MGRDFNENDANYLRRTSLDLGLNGLTELSVACWVKLTAAHATLTPRTMCKEDGATGQQTFDMFFAPVTPIVELRLENSTLVEGPTWNTDAAIPTGQWTRLLFTFKKNLITSADGIWYVNCVPVAITFSGVYTAAFVLKEASGTYTIGNNLTPNRPLNGSLAWVTVWNRQLTAQEVFEDYYDPLAVTKDRVSSIELCPDHDTVFGGALTVNGTVPCITPLLPTRIAGVGRRMVGYAEVIG